MEVDWPLHSAVPPFPLPFLDLEFRAGTILPQGQWEGERAPEFGRGAGHSVFVPSSRFGTSNLEEVNWDYHSEILLAKFPLVLPVN